MLCYTLSGVGLMPLSTIFQLYRGVSFICGENRPAASH